ncbi:MAG: 10 kDa chaperonin [Elusimicrobia bacterium]|nr:10 kDa chaperonin [Elusimicrobiota bacterium]
MEVVGKVLPSIGGVLVKVIELKKDDKLPKIYLPDEEKNRDLVVGLVLEVGIWEEKEFDAPCQKGDTILIEKWVGKDFEQGDDKLKLIKFHDVLAKVL